MRAPTPPIPDDSTGPATFASDAANVARWVGDHARQYGFDIDAAQARALRRFQRLHDDFIELERRKAPLMRLLSRRRVARGIYLWGGVGRGKSFLMDGFFGYAPLADKRRVHFHRFMQEIHRGLRERQGEANPLNGLARDIAGRTRLICLDEFHITDITDAMLMRRLLEGLIEHGTVLVTTSNFPPDDLYEHGLQRSQFLPAIELIKQNLEIVNVDGGTDYRLRELEKAGVYHVGRDGDEKLERAFTSVARHEHAESGNLEIEGRAIRVRKHAQGVAWFDFGHLCDGPRGKPDYIELARRYHTVLISDMPRFTVETEDALRRFVWLVDEFYDRRVKLLLAAAAPLTDLVSDGGSDDAFQRRLNQALTERLVSRLTEMQTRDYLSRPHLP